MITLERAKQALEASEKKARDLGIAISTVIVDSHGSIIASSRMDNAIPISPKFAYAKAFTAANIGFKTSDIAPNSVEGKPYFGLNTLFGGELTVIAGGVPITENKTLVGGVGVGGSYNVSQDEECAQTATKLLSK